MEILGYLASLLIGVSLGLTGSGGAILTVPVLVYIFRLPPLAAATYSLFVVGASSFTGIFSKYRQGLLDMRTALLFGAPSIATVIITRKFILPHIPDIVLSTGSVSVTKDILLMFLFGALMIFAAISVLFKKLQQTDGQTRYSVSAILVQGAITGIVTGLMGAGGGFLIIPALMLFRKLTVQQAAGTSLLIVSANSLIGFAAALPEQSINWGFLGIISLLAVAGIFIGNHLSRLVDGAKLKTGFGVFILGMGIYVIIREVTLVTF